jgi:hypothetical protein
MIDSLEGQYSEEMFTLPMADMQSDKPTALWLHNLYLRPVDRMVFAGTPGHDLYITSLTVQGFGKLNEPGVYTSQADDLARFMLVSGDLYVEGAPSAQTAEQSVAQHPAVRP